MQWIAVAFQFLGLLGGRSAEKAAEAIQKAQFALQMAQSADQEKVARRQVKRATDQANLLLAKSNLKDQYEAALQDLGDKGSTDAQRIADDFASERVKSGKEYFGGDSDTTRETKLQFLRDARENRECSMLLATKQVLVVNSLVLVLLVSRQNGLARIINQQKEYTMKWVLEQVLRADLGSTQDMDLMTAMGGTELQGASLGEEAMMKGLDVDYQMAETDLATAMRKKAAKAAKKGHDIDFGYTLPSTISPGIDPALTSKLSSAQRNAQMFSGLGDIASSIANW